MHITSTGFITPSGLYGHTNGMPMRQDVGLTVHLHQLLRWTCSSVILCTASVSPACTLVI